MKNDVVVLSNESAIAVFTGEVMDETLKKIESEVLSFVPDTSTDGGRKAIASLSGKVSRSKTALDNAGKSLVSDWKSKAKLVDASRKKARDFLDNLRDKARQPLTDWEIAEEERKAALEAKQAAEREAKRIAAEKEAEAQRKIDEAKRLEKEAIAKAEQLKIDAINAENRAKCEAEQAEKNRLQAIEDARIAKERAIFEVEEKARLEAQRVENARLAAEAEEKRKADKLAANKAHRTKINKEALNCFVEHGISEVEAKKIITLIAKNQIKNITINY